mgnify:CR=1 FL=1
MATPTHPLGSFLLLLNRLALGVYAAAAGADRLFHVFSGEFVKSSFFELRPAWLPAIMNRPMDYAVAVVALVGGLLLAAGFYTRWAAIGLAAVGGVVTLALFERFGIGGGGAAHSPQFRAHHPRPAPGVRRAGPVELRHDLAPQGLVVMAYNPRHVRQPSRLRGCA